MRAVFITLMLLSAPLTLAALPAFPGAEGFGSDTIGGRGGKVIHVSNLNDRGEGSLRAAINDPAPRTVVFDISGTITLDSSLVIRNPYITIAGQTAPGDGITLRGNTLAVNTHDVVIRFIRSRLGDEINPKAQDAISIYGGQRIILDHVSASWSIDEVLSPSGDIQDVTIQWSYIAEPLNRSQHEKGRHGYNMLLRATGGVSIHHNLFAHGDVRSPRFGDHYFTGNAPTFDFRNNLIYGWGKIASGDIDGRMRVNYINNYLKPNAESSQRAPIVFTAAANEDTQFYVSGNIVEQRDALSQNQDLLFSAEKIRQGSFTQVREPFATPLIYTHSAQESYALVLAHAGASLPKRDAVDLRISQQVKTGTGKIIDSVQDVGGWPVLKSAPAPLDSDQDGMPDAWEIAEKLNPNDASDDQQLRADGYTWLEHYLNSLAAKVSTY